jgi:hypothetical protein
VDAEVCEAGQTATSTTNAEAGHVAGIVTDAPRAPASGATTSVGRHEYGSGDGSR